MQRDKRSSWSGVWRSGRVRQRAPRRCGRPAPHWKSSSRTSSSPPAPSPGPGPPQFARSEPQASEGHYRKFRAASRRRAKAIGLACCDPRPTPGDPRSMFQVVLSLIASIAAIGVAVGLYRRVISAPTSTDRANEIAAAIRAGAEAFLSRQYQTIAKVGLPILLVVRLFLGWWYALGFVIGAAASAAAGFIGMNVSVRANLRVAEAAKTGFGRAFQLAFQGGTVTGLMVVGAGLVSLAMLVLCMDFAGYHKPDALGGLALGGAPSWGLGGS